MNITELMVNLQLVRLNNTLFCTIYNIGQPTFGGRKPRTTLLFALTQTYINVCGLEHLTLTNAQLTNGTLKACDLHNWQTKIFILIVKKQNTEPQT